MSSVILATTGAANGDPTPTPGRGLDYVSLGDSYATGYGLPDPTGDPTARCGQSEHNYPHRVAGRSDFVLEDETCAGATTADITSKSSSGLPAQMNALNDETAVVTITIGGNDSGLFSKASMCLALAADGPVLSGSDAPNCRSRFVQDGVDALRKKVDGTVRPAIARTLRAVRRAAPNAVLVMVGYPTVFPDQHHTPASGCFRAAVGPSILTGSFPSDSFPFTDTDVRYFHGLQVDLDHAMARAAHAQHVTYVSMLTRTAAHSPCSKKAQYVNGLFFTATSNLDRINLEPQSLHPTEAGAAALANAATRGIRTAMAAAATGQSTASPERSTGGSSLPVVKVMIGAALLLLLAAVGVLVLVRRRRRH